MFGPQYVICRPCRRYKPMSVADKDLDRAFAPCPFRCTLCQQRGEIVDAVADGFASVENLPAAGRPQF